jgi:hypothetical protein
VGLARGMDPGTQATVAHQLLGGGGQRKPDHHLS